MDMRDEHVCTLYIYTFFHTYMDIYAYMYIYLYEVKILFRFAEFLDEILLERNETWLWKNKISAKFREISFHDETVTTMCEVHIYKNLPPQDKTDVKI